MKPNDEKIGNNLWESEPGFEGWMKGEDWSCNLNEFGWEIEEEEWIFEVWRLNEAWEIEDDEARRVECEEWIFELWLNSLRNFKLRWFHLVKKSAGSGKNNRECD
jgi:hypothetical protein